MEKIADTTGFLVGLIACLKFAKYVFDASFIT